MVIEITADICQQAIHENLFQGNPRCVSCPIHIALRSHIFPPFRVASKILKSYDGSMQEERKELSLEAQHFIEEFDKSLTFGYYGEFVKSLPVSFEVFADAD